MISWSISFCTMLFVAVVLFVDVDFPSHFLVPLDRVSQVMSSSLDARAFLTRFFSSMHWFLHVSKISIQSATAISYFAPLIFYIHLINMMRLNPRKGNKNKNQAATNSNTATPAAVSSTPAPPTTTTSVAAAHPQHVPVSHAVNIPKVSYFVNSKFRFPRHHCVESTSSRSSVMAGDGMKKSHLVRFLCQLHDERFVAPRTKPIWLHQKKRERSSVDPTFF